MCTAISFMTKDHYFGRNLDLDHSYDECVCIVPRNFPLHFRCTESLTQHFAMIGIATVVDDYPLFYDATNEYGLSIAGLNFPGNAEYLTAEKRMDNITPFELIPWILAQCKTVVQAEALLHRLRLVRIPFSGKYSLTPLHWIVADRERSITVEPLNDGLHIHVNPVGVLTNNPFFDYHMVNLANYINLTREMPESRFSDNLALQPYSLGMGAMGLPGDLSSASRFVRATFTKLNSVCRDDELSSVSQFFHVLDSVVQQNGCCRTEHGFEKTVYSSCCNTVRGIYYYITYDNRQISAVDMHKADLNRTILCRYPLITKQQIYHVN